MLGSGHKGTPADTGLACKLGVNSVINCKLILTASYRLLALVAPTLVGAFKIQTPQIHTGSDRTPHPAPQRPVVTLALTLTGNGEPEGWPCPWGSGE